MKKNNIHSVHLKKIKKSIYITNTAKQQITKLIKKNNKQGIRINMIQSGCAGFRYKIELINTQFTTDIIYYYSNIMIAIPSKILLFLDGLIIDFIKNGLNHEFKFKNSIIKDTCGCGKSFSI